MKRMTLARLIAPESYRNVENQALNVRSTQPPVADGRSLGRRADRYRAGKASDLEAAAALRLDQHLRLSI